MKYEIAVCDDDRRFRQVIIGYLEDVLKDVDYAVTEYDRGSTLLPETGKFDMIFLDVELPGEKGTDIAKKIKDIPVILLSGYPEIVYADWKNYACAYLEKPVYLKDFTSTVTKIINERGKKKMSIEKVREHMKKYGLEDRIQEFDVSSATVELAAKALNCEECRIAKTLSFAIEDRAILIVVAGDAKIDNKKYKQTFSTKAKMLAFEDVERLIGYGVGGVCPFAVNEGVEVYLDESLKRFETVFPACGTSNSAIEVSIPELEKCSGMKEWVDVCKF